MAQMTELVRIENLSYFYPYANIPAVREVTLNLVRGQIQAILGASGSGKSTLLEILGGIRGAPDSYFPEGELKNAKFEKPEWVGLMLQDSGFQIPRANVTQAIVFGMENMQITRDEMIATLDRILKLLRIEHLRDRDVNTLSGGQQQIVVLASILAMKPQVLLVDEIISALDPGGQKLVREVLTMLRDQGYAICVVDCDADWVSGVADRIAVMHEGSLPFNGTPEQLALQPDLLAFTGAKGNGKIEFKELIQAEAVAIINVSDFTYPNGFRALSDVQVTIPKGSCVGLIGSNGSGKTTLVKLLAGILPNAEGQITVGGGDLFGLPSSAIVKKVVYLWQNPASSFAYPTIGEEFYHFRDKLGIPPVDGLTLEYFGLGGMEGYSPHKLSVGAKQRLALACALQADPELIILDEPTKGQSQSDRAELSKQIELLQALGKTIILISHDWSLIARSANSVMVLEHGKILADGSAQDVFADHALFARLELPLPWATK